MSEHEVAPRHRGSETAHGETQAIAEAVRTPSTGAPRGHEVFHSWTPTNSEGTWPKDPHNESKSSALPLMALSGPTSLVMKARGFGAQATANPPATAGAELGTGWLQGLGDNWQRKPVYGLVSSCVWRWVPLLREVAGEYAELIVNNLGQIAATTAALLVAEAASVSSLAIPAVGPIVAGAIQAGIAAFKIHDIAGPAIEASKHHGENWYHLASTANGDTAKLDEASREWLRMWVTLLGATAAGKSAVGNVGKSVKHLNRPAQSVPAADAVSMNWNPARERWEYPRTASTSPTFELPIPKAPTSPAVRPKPWLSPLAPVTPAVGHAGIPVMAGGSFSPGDYHDPNELVAHLQSRSGSYSDLSALDRLIETAPANDVPYLLRLKELQTETQTATSAPTAGNGHSTTRRAPHYPDAKLLVLANRVPGEKAQGGLVAGVKAGLEGQEAVWAGSAGTVPNWEAAKEHHGGSEALRLVGYDIEAVTYRGYYEGYANETAWPGKHGILDKINYNESHFELYVAANRFLAEKAGTLVNPDATIWVHDYHLYPQAELWRPEGQKGGHRGPIGHFDHIPVAPFHLLSQMPRWEDLIKWALHYDLVGVHIPRYKDNFMMAAEKVGAKRIGDSILEYNGRQVQVGAYPIGIDPKVFAYSGPAVTPKEDVPEKLREMVPGYGEGMKVILGVERADYTKGIPDRLKAYRELLRGDYRSDHAKRDWIGKVVFVQVAVPSRVGIDKFDKERQDVQDIVKEINDEFGTKTWTPVVLLEESIQQKDLGRWYRSADVTMVTPLQDGMNLVAKEKVAAQNPHDPKVLLLSKNAGAAHQLNNALLTDPYSVEDMAEKLNYALEMGLEERKARHAPMFENVNTETAAWWSKMYLSDLEKTRR